MDSLFYKDERYCKNCDEFTLHKCIDGVHERDSSDDYQQCLICGWHKYGFMIDPEPPDYNREIIL
jgi:hypothetical protein